MTAREKRLLKAAKAAGIAVIRANGGVDRVNADGVSIGPWSPDLDVKDAVELMLRLSIMVKFMTNGAGEPTGVHTHRHERRYVEFNGNRKAAFCELIVEAAAAKAA